MRRFQPRIATRAEALPRLWLLTDARTDPWLDHAIDRLPRGSGVIFRHYHLPEPERRQRFRALVRRCGKRGLMPVLAGSARDAAAWGAAGHYAARPGRHRAGLPWIATAHDLAEIAGAARQGAALVMLSPVYPTRTHPGAPALGSVRFALIAGRSAVPVVALGGMTAARARRLPMGNHGWAAIDGMVPALGRRRQKRNSVPT